jgi:tRNA-specific 2-thiouridylase
VGEGKDHPGLYRKGLFIKKEDIHWLRDDLELPIGTEQDYEVRIRYRQNLQNATIKRTKEGLYISFYEAQRGVTPGQFAAWYQDGELIGSGVIA